MKWLEDLGGDILVASELVTLFVLVGDSGVSGLLGAVHMLLVRVLSPFVEVPEELEVLELSFRNLLKAPILDIGGLDAVETGFWARWDSGAA
jgi:hypothetical protein